MRQNALVNFSRLSKDKQKELNNIIANDNDYKASMVHHNFTSLVDYFFVSDFQNIKEKRFAMLDLCDFCNLNIVDYKSLEKEIEYDDSMTYSYRTMNLLKYCEQNYLTKDEYDSHFSDLTIQNLKMIHLLMVLT